MNKELNNAIINVNNARLEIDNLRKFCNKNLNIIYTFIRDNFSDELKSFIESLTNLDHIFFEININTRNYDNLSDYKYSTCLDSYYCSLISNKDDFSTSIYFSDKIIIYDNLLFEFNVPYCDDEDDIDYLPVNIYTNISKDIIDKIKLLINI